RTNAASQQLARSTPPDGDRSPAIGALWSGRGLRRSAVQEWDVERRLGDRDRWELETRRRGRQRAEILGWRGKPLIRIGARSHDLNVRRHWLAHRDRPVPKLVGQLVSAERGRCDERREERSGRSDLELPDG